MWGRTAQVWDGGQVTANPFSVAERLAAQASMEQLAEITSPGYTFFKQRGSPTHFCCPRCRHVGNGGGSALIRSEWEWACWTCKAQGTIAEVRRLVLDNPEYVVALLAVVR